MSARAGRAPCAFLLLVFCACATADGERSERDGGGAAAPRRIVSLVPAVTEILLELGAGDRLVARAHSDHASALAHLPSVGEELAPNLEALVAVAPDLVIVWSDLDAAAFERVLGAEGRVRSISIDRLADIDLAIERVGAWLGEEAAAGALRSELARSLRAAERPIADEERPTILWVVWSDPAFVAGPGTFLGDVIELVGGRNAAGGLGAPWPRLAPEPLVDMDPTVLVWPEGAGLFPRAQLPRRMPWRLLTAVRSNRVLAVDAPRFHVAGPGVGSAAVALARSLDSLEAQ